MQTTISKQGGRRYRQPGSVGFDLASLLPSVGKPPSADLVLGFMGDSNWDPTGPTTLITPTCIGNALQAMGFARTVTIVNRAASGTTATAVGLGGGSDNWTPTANGGSGRFDTAMTDFQAASVQYVPIMLLTNDGGDSVTVPNATTSMGFITAGIVARGMIPILVYPPYRWDTPSIDTNFLEPMQAQLDGLADGTTILNLPGNLRRYNWLKANNVTADGVHFNPTGSAFDSAQVAWGIWRLLRYVEPTVGQVQAGVTYGEVESPLTGTLSGGGSGGGGNLTANGTLVIA